MKKPNIKDVYKSGIYYKEIFPSQIDLADYTRWMSNYYCVIKNIFPQIKTCKNKNILELGSSYGGFVNKLNIEGFGKVTASDMNDKIFSKDLKNDFLKIDITDYSGNKKYDIIFAFDVMEHIEKTQKAISNIYNLLNKSGIFIFTAPYPVKKHLMDRYHINMQYPNYYTNMFYRNKFECLKIEDITFIPIIWKFSFPRFIKRIMKNKYCISETFYIFRKL